MKVFGFLEKAQAENLGSDLGSALKGLFWFNTVSNDFKFADGSAVRTIVSLDKSQTLTNKVLTGNIVANVSPDGVNTLTLPAATDTLVGRATTDTLTNKTLTGAIADLFVMPHQTTPASPSAGRIKVYSKNDNFLYKLDSDGNEVKVGSASGELNFYEKGDADISKVADFTLGNNAVFGGGGSAQGVLTVSTSNPFRGTKSFQYVLNATPGNSNNDYVESENISIPTGYRGRYLHVKLQYAYSGANSDIKWVVKDKTNSSIISIGDEFLEQFISADNTAKEFNFAVYIPSDCAQISIGPQVVAHASGSEVLKWDDVVVTPNLYAVGNLGKDAAIYVTGNAGESITAGVTDIPFATVEINKNLSNSWSGSQFTVPEQGVYHFDVSAYFTTLLDRQLFVYVNGTQRAVISVENNSSFHKGDYAEYLEEGDTVSFRVLGNAGTLNNSPVYHYLSITSKQLSEHVVTPARSNLTDWADYTPITQGIGTPTIQYCRYRRVGDSLELEARLTTGNIDAATEFQFGLPAGLTVSSKYTSTVYTGVFHRSVSVESHYSTLATAGDSFLNAGFRNTASAPLLTPQTSDSILGSFEAGVLLRATVKIEGWDSGANFLAALPIGRVAYIKDVKANSTPGGTFTAGALQQRDLNTIEGDTSFISVASNIFYLEAGRYNIRGKVPAFACNTHVAKMVRSSDDVVVLDGQQAYSGNVGSAQSLSHINGGITITEKTGFKIMHECETTGTTNGFGVSNTLSGPSIFTALEIEKVK